MCYKMPEEDKKDIAPLFMQKKLPNYMLSQLIQSEESGWKEVQLLRNNLKRYSLEEKLSEASEIDIEEAQERDYYMWNEYLKEFPQTLYDIFEGNYSGEELNEEEERFRKLFLDMSYLHIQSAMEDIKNVVKNKYPDKSEWIKKLQL